MSPEIWTIIGTAIGLAAVLLSGQRALRNDLGELRKELTARMERLENRVTDLDKRMAHLTGLLEGLREAIAHNR